MQWTYCLDLIGIYFVVLKNGRCSTPYAIRSETIGSFNCGYIDRCLFYRIEVKQSSEV